MGRTTSSLCRVQSHLSVVSSRETLTLTHTRLFAERRHRGEEPARLLVDPPPDANILLTGGGGDDRELVP